MSVSKQSSTITSKLAKVKSWKEIELRQTDWLNHFNYFLYQNQDFSNPQNNFFILLPPPNITGALHLGHVWNVVLQDFLIKWEKLFNQKSVLWLPGFDHAGIATQIVIWKLIDNLNLSIKKTDKDRINRLFWEGLDGQESYKEKTIRCISEQLKKFNLSLDYKNTYFTLDENVSKLVKESFINYFKAGIIYQAEKIVHWDPILKTAISDLEVKFVPQKTKLYYFKYYHQTIKDFYLEIATTRPETIFADTALICNPRDKRYQKYINNLFINPFTKKLLPLLVDEKVDINFGTGVMKCTPAHDFYDFEIGEKNHLEKLVCLSTDGKLNNLCQEFSGLSIQEGRKKIVEKYQNNLLSKIEDYENLISISSRSGGVVEPYLSKQYFLKVSKLVQLALKHQQNLETKINFYPQKFEKVFLNWLHNCQDWCISRQLLIGHQIPLFLDQDNNLTLDKKNSVNQIKDVLDTWYSSSLLPLLFLPFHRNQDKLKYLSSVLVTGYDILFFWVVRMILQSTFFKHKIPFQSVYLHGLIRDKFNKKMSKSNNNGIDPIHALNIYSTDTLRLFFLENSSLGNDLRYDEEKLILNYRFFTKIINVFRLWESLFKNKKTNQKVDNFLFWKKQYLNKFGNAFLEFWKKISNDYSKFKFNVLVQEFKNFWYDQFANQILLEIKANIFLFTQEDLRVYFQIILVLSFPFLPSLSSFLLSKYFNITPETFLLNSLFKTFFNTNKPKTNLFQNQIINDLFSKTESLISDQKVEIIFLKFLTNFPSQEKIILFLIQKSQKLKILNSSSEKEIKEYKIHHENQAFQIFIKVSNHQKNWSPENNLKSLQAKINDLKLNIENKNKILKNPKILANAKKEFILMIKNDLQKKEENLNKLQLKLKKLIK